MFKPSSSTSATCDLCGKKSSECPFYVNEKYLCVCQECKDKLEETPISIRNMLEKYLIGNVM